MNRINLSESELAELAARIQRNYSYDDQSGQLVNRKTGRAVKGRKSARRNGEYRYLVFQLYDNGRCYEFQLHQAVWAWHHGRFPSMQIDHLNGDRYDNRIGNLREVSGSENKLNMEYPWKAGKGSPVPGVNFNNRSYRIKVGQKEYYSSDPYHLFYHLTLAGRRFRSLKR